MHTLSGARGASRRSIRRVAGVFPDKAVLLVKLMLYYTTLVFFGVGGAAAWTWVTGYSAGVCRNVCIR